MRRWIISLTCYLGVLFSVGSCEAEPRLPGKYSGVVIYDRWDACMIYNGIYVTYVSEEIKKDLRKYAGQAVQIDVKDIVQPINPGDGCIKKFDFLNAIPKDQGSSSFEGISLESSVNPCFPAQLEKSIK